LLFSETSSEVKNNRLQWTSPLCGLDRHIDRGVRAKNIRMEKQKRVWQRCMLLYIIIYLNK
jgi:hypothetical protein